MEYYNIRVTNSTKIALTLIFVPLIMVPSIILTAVYLPALPEWAVITMLCVAMALIILLTVYLVKKLAPHGTLTLHDDGFDVTFMTKDIFTPAPFSAKISDVTNFFAEGKGGLYYLSFTTNTRPYKFNIEARSKDEADLTSFYDLMGKIANMVQVNNAVHLDDGKTIAAVSIYEKWWAKLIAAGVVIIVVLIVGLKLFFPHEQAPEWWRLTTVFIFGVPFIYKVWYHNYRKKSKQPL